MLRMVSAELGIRCSIRLSCGTICDYVRPSGSAYGAAPDLRIAQPYRRGAAAFPPFARRRWWDGAGSLRPQRLRPILQRGAAVPARWRRSRRCRCVAARWSRKGTVGRVIDVNTFALDNGREIRLAAIALPPRPPPRP